MFCKQGRDKSVGFIHQRRDVHQIVVADAVSLFPFTAFFVAVGLHDGHIEQSLSAVRFVLPDRRFDAAMAKRMDRRNWP